MSIEYAYEIVNVDEAARCMEVVYSANGHQTMHIGARLPFEGEALEDVIRQYAPLAYWLEQQRPVSAPPLGTIGTLFPVVETAPAVEDPGFTAIFPTAASGAIAATIFK